jgi:tetratricopeptide (TPR) repeat protein
MRIQVLLAGIVLGLALAQTPQTQNLINQAKLLAGQARASGAAPSPDAALWKQALAKAEEAAKLEPSPATWQLLGELYSETRFWSKAELAWGQYIKLKGGEVDPLLAVLIGGVYLKQGYEAYSQQDLQRAENYFQQALEITPDDAKTHEALGKFYLDQGDSRTAFGYWQKAHSLAPNETNRYFLTQSRDMVAYGPQAVKAFSLGYQAYKEANLSVAFVQFDLAQQNAPAWLEAQRWFGRVALEVGQPEPALQAWQAVSASKQASNGDKYYLQLAQLGVRHTLPAARSYLAGIEAHSAGKADIARIHFSEATALTPSFAQAWYWLGRTAYEAKDFVAAVQAYGKVVELEPANAEARYWLEQAKKGK